MISRVTPANMDPEMEHHVRLLGTSSPTFSSDWAHPPPSVMFPAANGTSTHAAGASTSTGARGTSRRAVRMASGDVARQRKWFGRHANKTSSSDADD